MSPSSTYMYQPYPAPCVESNGCEVFFIEMKYFEKDIIGEYVDRHLVCETLDHSAVVVDTGIVTAENTNREIVLHKGLLPRDIQIVRDHASR